MRSFLLLSLLTLAACGFKPLHGQSYRQETSADLASVSVVVDNSRRGQLLEAEIKRGINPDARLAEKTYTLNIKLAEHEVPLFINPDGTSSRGDIQFTSRYTVTRRPDAKVLQEGTINRVASYNTSESADYASYVSIEDAKTRGIIELAQAYKLRMSNLLPGLSGRTVLPSKPPEPNKLPEEISLPTRLQTTP